MENIILLLKSFSNDKDITTLFLDNSKLYIGTENLGLFYTDLSYTTLNPINGLPANNKINTVCKTKYNILVGTDKGVYSSNDGINFVKETNSLVTKTIKKIIEINNKIYVGTTEGLYTSSNGNSFTKISGSLGSKYINTISYISNKIYVG